MASKKNELGVQIGKRIQYLRKQKGFSQEKFAEAINIATTSLSYIETGRGFMTLQTLERISETLEVEPCEIFQFVSNKTKEEMYDFIVSKLNNIKNDAEQMKIVYSFFLKILFSPDFQSFF